MTFTSIRAMYAIPLVAACFLFAGCSQKSSEDSSKKNGKGSPNVKLQVEDPASNDEHKTRLHGETEQLLFPPRETEGKKSGIQIEDSKERLEIPPRVKS